MEFKSVSIILGAIDENEALKKTVDSVMESCNEEDIAEFVIVKSANITPECLKIIEGLINTYGERIRTFVQSRPYVGGAIRDGIDSITTTHTMLLASDMAQDLNCVPSMIEGVKKHPDIIYSTSRWINPHSFHGYGRIKLIINFFAQIFLRILYNKNLTDFTNPVQIFPTALFQSIKWDELQFPFLLEMVLKPLRLGYEFIEVPTSCYKRSIGKSKNSFYQTSRYLYIALKVRFMKKKNIFREIQ